MDFHEALTGLWEAWMILARWVPFWDPWGAVAAAFFMLYFFGRLTQYDQT